MTAALYTRACSSSLSYNLYIAEVSTCISTCIRINCIDRLIEPLNHPLHVSPRAR